VRRFRLRLPVKCSELRSWGRELKLEAEARSLRSRSGRLSGLLSGCPPTDTRPQARAKLGNCALSLKRQPLQGLSTSRVKKSLSLSPVTHTDAPIPDAAASELRASSRDPLRELQMQRHWRRVWRLVGRARDQSTHRSRGCSGHRLRCFKLRMIGQVRARSADPRSRSGVSPWPWRKLNKADGCRRRTIACERRFWLYPRHFPPAGAARPGSDRNPNPNQNPLGRYSKFRHAHAHRTGV